MKDRLFKIAPNLIQEVLISLFNKIQYHHRYGGKYKQYRKLFNRNRSLSLIELKEIQNKKYNDFLKYVVKHSMFYRNKYANIDNFQNLENIKSLPIINKEKLRKNIESIITISKKEGVISKTGGTTGKSLEVIFTKENMQERFAMLDNFRSKFGYELGEKTAWFSGKSILTSRDVKKNHFWKTDFVHNVRYYSTFHINEKYLKFYIENLIKYKPEFFVGFPLAIYQIALYGIKNKIDFPANTIKAVFPTAETITDNIRNVIEGFFKTKMYDQYASSEGAPFIFECKNNNLHFELQSGVIEVLDEDNNECEEGRLVITSFATYGTPLIRYDIGDQVKLSLRTCDCGDNNPLVEKIVGRLDDYIYSDETGRITIVNLANALKGTKNIINFQAIQNKLAEIEILLVVNENAFSNSEKELFIKNIRQRIGDKMALKMTVVDDIPVEKSGKYRMIKNNIKQLV